MLQVKAALHFGVYQPPRLCLSLTRFWSTQVNYPQSDFGCFMDDLYRLSVRLRKACPQRLVPAHDLSHALFKRCGLQSSSQSHGQRDVIGRAQRRQLLQKPEPLLREGEWQPNFARRAPQYRRGGAVAVAALFLKLLRQFG